MNNKSGILIYWFLLGTILCLLPLIWVICADSFGIGLQAASELIPSFAKVDQNQVLQLEMPIYWIRQQYIPYFTEIKPFYTEIIAITNFIGLLTFAYGIKHWANISNKQFYLGIGIWIAITLFKAIPSSLSTLPSSLIPHPSSLSTLPSYLIPLTTPLIPLTSLILLAIVSSQTIPHLILQFGRKASFDKTRKTYLLLYFFFLLNIVVGLYLQQAGNALRSEFMVTALSIQWALFWFQVVSNPVLQQYKTLLLGIFILAIPGLLWFYLHQNDPAIRFAYEWNFRCISIMALLFPAFIYSNFKELFTQNLALHTVIFKAHRIKLYIYQIGVLIIALAWTFAGNASLYHVGMAGYYNQTGDIESLSGKPQLAKISYQMAQGNSRLNLKSNFELAKRSTSDEEKAQFIQYTLTKRPHPYTYLSLADIYKKNDHPFQSLFTLEEGFTKFPESYELATALAIQYEKLNQPKDAQKYFEIAYRLVDSNPLLAANYLYSNVHLGKKTQSLAIQDSEDLGLKSNQLAASLVAGKKIQEKPITDFTFQHNVQHFAYLYNASLAWKSQAPKVNFEQIFKNQSNLQTFPELQLVDAWQDFYSGKRLRSLQKISFLKETYAGKDANPYEQVFYFWHNTLNEHIKSIESLKGTPEQLLEKFPFSVELQNKYFPVLNAQKKDKIAYDYALAAIQFNPNKSELYPNYIFQAIQLIELEYAKEAMAKLKNLNPTLYSIFFGQFESKRKEMERKRSTW